MLHKFIYDLIAPL